MFQTGLVWGDRIDLGAQLGSGIVSIVPSKEGTVKFRVA